MIQRKTDLLIEFSPEETATSPLPAPPVQLRRDGFDLLSSSRGKDRCHTVLCGAVWLSPPEDRARLSRLLSSLLAEYLGTAGVGRAPTVLAVGLGNPHSAADALGCSTVDRLFIPDPRMREMGLPALCTVKPSVPARSGCDTAELVRSAAEAVHADLILTVDALAARDRTRLQTVVQIGNLGITPGSALSHTSGEISTRTMPCPVLSLGVPTVIRSDVLTGQEEEEILMVTRADADRITECYGNILASAINRALFGNIS